MMALRGSFMKSFEDINGFGTDIQEQDQKESQNQTKPSTEWKGQSQRYINRGELKRVIKQEVKRAANSSSISSSQNMAFVSSPSSTNEVNTAYGVSTNNMQVSNASTQVSIASTQVSNANLSDAIVYAFLANQLNGSQLVHEDLE
ncbi:hypothetical protein Tco_0240872 [Tanacetum coccineum]